MALELQYPHIEKVEGEPARMQRTPRVRVAQIIIDYLAYRWSPDEMCRQHAYLTLAEAHAAMAYYFDHQVEIDSEILAELSEFDATHKGSQESPLRQILRRKGLL
jgi:hypothetical protein